MTDKDICRYIVLDAEGENRAYEPPAVINRAGPWTAPVNGRGIKGDAMNLVGTLVLLGVIAMIHQWLGHPVFLGTYY